MTQLLEKRASAQSRLKRATKEHSAAQEELLKLLIYEMDDDKPVYYRGYKEVLERNLPPEAVMGSGFLQSSIVAILVAHLLPLLRGKYEVLTNEFGILYKKGNWKAADIAIYSKEQLKDVPFEDKYLDIPPKVVIEVDTKADMELFGSFSSYYISKTETLLDFGVGKVIWILTKEKKILQAEPKKDWIISNWNAKVVVAGKASFVLETLLKNR